MYEILSSPTPVSMADEWFEISSASHFWMEWRFRALMEESEKLPRHGARILEIGCGSGVFLEQLASSRLNYELHGCDLNESALKLIPTGLGRIMCYDILERHDQFREFYSSVFLMDVIEHLESDRDFIKAAAYHIAPGGLVVINVPAVQGLFSKYDSVAGHFRRYSKAALAKLLIDCGFEPIRVSFWGISLVPILFARKCLMPFVPASKAIKIGFSPPSRAADSLFRLMMRAELSFPLRFPVGTSLIAIGRKSVHI